MNEIVKEIVVNSAGDLSRELAPYAVPLFGKAWQNLKKFFGAGGVSAEEFQRIPANIAISAIEGIAITEHEKLIILWRRLLKNAADPNFKEEIRPAFTEIIKGLSPDDAVMLQQFAADDNYRPDYSDEKQKISRDNLKRLAVISNNGGYDGGRDRLSSLGAAFLRAVS